jgi:hypothetical protein
VNNHDPVSKDSSNPASSVEPEKFWEFFQDFLGWKKKYEKFRSFLKTRKLIKEGELNPISLMTEGKRPFNLSADEIKQRKLMGPFTYKLYQTVIIALPASLISLAISLFSSSETLAPPSPSKTPQALIDLYQPKIFALLVAFVGPVVFFALTAQVMSWAIALAPSRKRIRDAFLYYDATYSLTPQAILILTVTLLSIYRGGSFAFAYALFFLFCVGGFYQLIITFSEIPALLLPLNDHPRGGSLRLLYTLSVVFTGAPLVFAVREILYYLAKGCTILFVTLLVWLRG